MWYNLITDMTYSVLLTFLTNRRSVKNIKKIHTGKRLKSVLGTERTLER